MKYFLLLITLLGLSMSINAQNESRLREFFNEKGVGLQGYDPVSYFTNNKAVKGKKEYAVKADGITYYLSSASNKELFLAHQKDYEPQYGGWCAYAMGESGEKVEVDPETFKILNGKLFLFYNSFFNNTLTKWNKDEAKLHVQADKNWTKFFKQP